MRFLFVFPFFIITAITTAQDLEISGNVLDEEGKPLESATIYIEEVADSSLVAYTVSGRDGGFVVTGETDASVVNFKISFAGYAPHLQKVKIGEEEEEISMGNISLEIETSTLDEVMVTANRSPLTLKKDTLEFNASSFKTRQDANLEELLQQLPGVEVDRNGAITVNGKPVTNIKVNGKEFFGDDPMIATKNLPKEIIDKLQVVDTKTKAQEFTGEAGDPENKTINITIQEDKNRGYFARATAGGGTDERYELSGIGNYFQNDLRLSVLASSNNINSSGFSYDEVFGMMGRNAARSGGGNGITKAETAGLNFVNEWNSGLELNADYFFGRNDTERRSVTQTEYILPDQRYFENSDVGNTLLNDTHRARTEFEIEFDTLTRLEVEPRINANLGNSYRSRIAESLDENGNTINNTETFENEELENLNFGNEIDFIRRFGARGAYLGLEFSNNHNRQKNDNFYYSESMFREEGEEITEIQDQYIDEDEDEDNYSFEFDNRSVLADNFFLDISYDFDYAKSENQRYVYESENADGNYDRLNEILSSDFEAVNRRHSPNVGLNFEGDIWRINTDVGLLHTNLENNNFLEETSFENNYNNLFLNARVRYGRERSRSLSIRYDTEVDIPSIRELQPVVDRTNPLNIVVGNPELRPSYTQEIDLNYRNYDYSTDSGIFSWMSLDFTENDVVPVTTIDEDLVRTTTYTNVDGAIEFDVGASYSKQWKTESSRFRYRVRVDGSWDRNVGFTNAVKYNAERYSLRPGLRLTYAIDEFFEINPDYRLTYNDSRYDINPDRNENFINHRAGLQATTYWPENLVFGNDLSYNYFGNVSPGFENSSLLWNLSLGYQFLDDDAIVKIKAYDVLDQNVDTRRIIGDDFIRDTSNLILTRYAMLSFTYKVNQFGGGYTRED